MIHGEQQIDGEDLAAEKKLIADKHGSPHGCEEESESVSKIAPQR